jgi:methylenetetrahydrofolate dehydrogenase (NADP+)/methenyltetrahydrofolate cyclohydrolase/formyltetrahydrofolate synthetase
VHVLAGEGHTAACCCVRQGAPKGFPVHVRDVRASVGAGFLYPLLGDVMTVPGLGTRPGYYDMDIDTKTGKIYGLF